MNKQSNNHYEAGGDVNVDNSTNKTVTKNKTVNKNRNKTIIKNNKLAFVIVFAFLAIGIIGVTLLVVNNPSRQIVGRWRCTNNDKLYEFTKDGQMLYLSGSSDGMTIQYHTEKGRVQLNAKVLWGSATIIADLDISGNEMTWSNFIDPEDWFSAFNKSTMNFVRVE